jgi:hypothetical protein
MKVEMTFNNTAVESNGYDRSDIYYAIKSAFAKRDLPCSSDDEVLTFKDAGNENDFSHIWVLLINLLKADWFVKCASSCVFYDDDDTAEDVLSQAWKVQRSMA